MTIKIKLYSSLRNFADTDKGGTFNFELDEEKIKLIDLLKLLNINSNEVGLIRINSILFRRDNLFNEVPILVYDGDYIELFSAMKGG